MKSPKIALILSGSGYLDGAEIRESVFCLESLSRHAATVSIFAPDIEAEEVDHLHGNSTGEKRSVLREAARIARGKISPLEEMNPENFDALVLPGGFGAAKNLSDFASKGAECKLLPEVERVLNAFISEKKPIAAVCIAPSLLAKAFQKHGGLKLTIGNDQATAKEIEKLGSQHQTATITEICVDLDHKVVSTPAYMYDDAPIHEIADGIESCMQQLIKFCDS